MIWQIEEPDERRERHLILCLILWRFSVATVAVMSSVMVWVRDMPDFHFFVRVEGRHWLLFWLAIPCRFLTVCRLIGARENQEIDRRRATQLMLASILLMMGSGYW